MDTKKLRQKILDLAIHGKLVPQDPNDEPASVLLERIHAEKERLVKEGKIKKSKKTAKTSDTPHYEQVPFEVPESWVWTNIEELFFVTKLAGFEYTDYLTKDTISSNNEVPIVRAQNVRMGYFVENTNEAISEALSQQLERSALTKKCLLMTFIGAGIGDTCIFPALKRCHLAPNVAKIEPYSNKIDLKYGLYYLMSDLGQWGVRGISKSTAQPSLSMATIRSLEVALPPLAEQYRIVAEIEKWFELIDQIEQGKSDLQTTIKQAKSKILDLAIHGKLVPQDPEDEPAIKLLKRINPKFTPCDNGQYRQIPKTWLSVPLEALFDVNPKSKLEDKMEVGFVPMELVADGYSGTHSFESRKWAEVKKGYCHFANGDIGVAKISPCFENLKSTLFDNLPNGHGAGTTELVIMRNKGIHPKFYLYLFKSNWYIAQGTKYFKGVVGQQRVNREIFTTLHVPLPPLEEQQRIVARIEELFATLDKMQNSLEA